MSQLAFHFQQSHNYSRDNFINCAQNQKVFDFVTKGYEQYFAANEGIFNIYGKKDAGKSHLACIWQESCDAIFISAAQLENGALLEDILQNAKMGEAFIVENVEQFLQTFASQSLFLGLVNIVRSRKLNLLITSQISLKEMKFEIEDLSSRLKNIIDFEILPPDDNLTKMLLIKRFADKQMQVDSNVIDFLVPRIERSFAVIELILNQIEKFAIAQKRKVTIPLVSTIIEQKDERY